MYIMHLYEQTIAHVLCCTGPVEALSGWSGNKPGNDSEIADIASYIHHTLTFVTSLAVTLPFYML